MQLEYPSLPPSPAAQQILTRQARQIFCYALERGIETLRDINGSHEEKRVAAKTKARLWDFARTHTGSSGHRLNYLLRLRERRAPQSEIDEFDEVSRELEPKLLTQPPQDIRAALAREAGLTPDRASQDRIGAIWLKAHYDAAVKLAALIDDGADLQEALEAAQAEWRGLLAAEAQDRTEAARSIRPNPLAINISQAEPTGIQHPGASQAVNHKTVATMAEEFIADCLARRPDYNPRDVRLATRILTHALGDDKPMAQLTQADLRTFVTMLRKMPKSWGRNAADLKGGLGAVMQRAATLPPNQIGLSPQTEARHLSAISQIVKFAQASGINPATAIDIGAFAKERKKEKAENGRGRENWTAEEFKKLLTSPAFVGCKGPSRSDRHKPGRERYHDADYWMPLMLGLMGGRSSEFGGLMLEDLDIDAPIPSISVYWNGERKVKSVASKRQLPIHPELIRLGFLEYVRALKAAGQSLLFPELKFDTKDQTFSKIYGKHFGALRECVFPTPRSADGKPVEGVIQKCVHSLRGMTADLLDPVKDELVNAILGHKQVTTKAKHYRHFSLSDMLKAFECTAVLTEGLDAFPIRLNPLAISKRQAALGRPRASTQRVARSGFTVQFDSEPRRSA